MILVTAIYNKLNGTHLGGRLNRDRHYLYSLRNIAKATKLQIICYTSKNDIDDIQSFLTGNNITNVKLKLFELTDFFAHKRIAEIKEINKNLYAKDNVWEQRCVELMWLKLFWLYDESVAHKNEKVFWIDAGLSHAGILPKSLNHHDHTNHSYEESFDNSLAFNENFVNKIDSHSNGKIFSFYCLNRQHQYSDYILQKLGKEQKNPLGGSIVAGLFGGSFEQIESLVKYSTEIILDIMNGTSLLQEELILTLVYQDHPELFDVYSFQTWYHPDWNCFDKDQIPFCSFFEGLA